MANWIENARNEGKARRVGQDRDKAEHSQSSVGLINSFLSVLSPLLQDLQLNGYSLEYKQGNGWYKISIPGLDGVIDIRFNEYGGFRLVLSTHLRTRGNHRWDGTAYRVSTNNENNFGQILEEMQKVFAEQIRHNASNALG